MVSEQAFTLQVSGQPLGKRALGRFAPEAVQGVFNARERFHDRALHSSERTQPKLCQVHLQVSNVALAYR